MRTRFSYLSSCDNLRHHRLCLLSLAVLMQSHGMISALDERAVIVCPVPLFITGRRLPVVLCNQFRPESLDLIPEYFSE